jgi:Xaa-Pro aminopeptidase
MLQASFFTSNRERLTHRLSGGVAVFSAYTKMQRTNDIASAFEQEANFWWLTGIESPDWQLIIDGTRGKSWLVMPQVSITSQIFDGSLSAADAKEASGVSDILSHDEALKILRDLSKKHSVAYTLGDQPYSEYLDFVLNPAPKKLYEQLIRTFNSVRDCRKELAGLRAIKQPEEIVAIQGAINLTVDAFNEVKSLLATCKYEYEVEAAFTYHFQMHGLSKHAYDPIVAGGKNATTLHYVANNMKLKKRELLLLDIGARRDGYPADITRTYAAKEPTKRQVQVHAAVAGAQREIISLLTPELSVEQYQREVDRIMIESLMSLGLMADASDEKTYRRYFPHAVSHGLGVDVHDSLGTPKYFQPGMVLTVEPGIYIPEENIGVRIEDDIAITDTGHTNLSGRLSTDL